MKPIEVTLYDPETDEKKATFVKSFIPFSILKRALQVQKALDPDNMTENDVDELASLVVAAFRDKFTLADVLDGMDLGEMLTVLNEIVGRATQFVGGEKGNFRGAA